MFVSDTRDSPVGDRGALLCAVEVPKVPSRGRSLARSSTMVDCLVFCVVVVSKSVSGARALSLSSTIVDAHVSKSGYSSGTFCGCNKNKDYQNGFNEHNVWKVFTPT